MLIGPDAFEGCFTRWAQSLTRKVEREVVAIDGKTVRRSGSHRHDHGPLHLVSVSASSIPQNSVSVNTSTGVVTYTPWTFWAGTIPQPSSGTPSWIATSSRDADAPQTRHRPLKDAQQVSLSD